MTIAKHLAVIASTERLAPHDVLDASNNIVTIAFGLNLVTAMVWPTRRATSPPTSWHC